MRNYIIKYPRIYLAQRRWFRMDLGVVPRLEEPAPRDTLIQLCRLWPHLHRGSPHSDPPPYCRYAVPFRLERQNDAIIIGMRIRIR